MLLAVSGGVSVWFRSWPQRNDSVIQVYTCTY